MEDPVPRRKALLNIPPFVGYEFKDTPADTNEKFGIYVPEHDNPRSYIPLAKMRTNVYCLENPYVFKQTNFGKFTFQKNNYSIVKNQGRMSMVKNPINYDMIDGRYKVTSSINEDLKCSKTQPKLENLPPMAAPDFDTDEPVTRAELTKANMNRNLSQSIPAYDLGQNVEESMLPEKEKSSHTPIQKSSSICGPKHNRLPSLRNSASQMLTSLLKEGDPVFERQKIESKMGRVPKFGATFSTFAGRTTNVYDPSMKKGNFSRWNVNKNNVLSTLEKDREYFENNEELMNQIADLRQSSELTVKFPTYCRHKALPIKYVYNDYHTKNTAPGYDRNNYGKPYFS